MSAANQKESIIGANPLRAHLDIAFSVLRNNWGQFSDPEKKQVYSSLDYLAHEGLSSPDIESFRLSADIFIQLGTWAPKGGESLVPQYADLFHNALESVGSHIDTLHGHIINRYGEPDRAIQSMSMLYTLATKDVSPETKAKAYEILETSYDDLLFHMLTGKYHFDEGIKHVLTQDPQKWLTLDEDLTRIASSISREEFNPCVLSLSMELDEMPHTLAEFIGIWSLVHMDYLPQEANALIKQWKEYLPNPEGVHYRNVGDNLVKILETESKFPGLTKWLQQERGILHFGRYPTELLLSQYETQEKVPGPWAALVFPHDDWNGAFHHTQRLLLDTIEHLNVSQKNSTPHRWRIIEGNNTEDIFTKLEELSRIYGSPSFTLLGGHGSKNSIAFGNTWGNESILQTRDFSNNKKIAQLVKQVFTPESSVILMSCQTGMVGGIAQELSKLGISVFGPDISTNLVRIHPELNGNRIFFSLMYGRDAKVMHYYNGELVGE
jgi:hypothetical protein